MKKLLALVLALVMTLSLCTVTNAAYPDAADVDFDEAVDVMSALGVFKGDEKGNFNPDATLTRETAAKLIAYLDLGEKVAEALPAVKVFSDVEANRWSAKYVAYCADAGYIAGVGDGSYNPTGELTGYAFGKLLLCVLGYDATIEGFTGANWSIAVAKLMQSNNIADGVDKAASAVLTREEAAQYCLNALKADCVEYDDKGTQISINGATIATGASKAEAVENKSFDYMGRTVAEDGIQQLCEKLYKKDLTLADGNDALGRPADVWTYKAEEVGKYAEEADLTLVAKKNYADAKAAYVDLKDEDYSKAAPTTKVNGETDTAILKGDVIEYYIEDGVLKTAAVTRYTVGKVTKVDTKVTKAEAKDDVTCKITVKTVDEASTLVNALADTKFADFSYAKGDVILFAKNGAGDKVIASKLAASVEGKVTATKSGKAAIDGTYYTDNLGVALDEEGTFYLNAADQIIAKDAKVTKSSDYAYLYTVSSKTGVNSEGINTTTYTAYYVDQTGAKASAVVEEDSVSAATEGSVVAYKVNSDKELEVATAEDTIESVVTTSAVVDKNNATIASGIYANGTTKFVFVDKTATKVKVSTVEGYKNVKIAAGTKVIAITDSKDYAVYAFVLGTNGSLEETAKLAVMLDTTYEVTKDTDNTYYTFSVAVDGEETTLTTKKTAVVADMAALTKGDVFTYDLDGKYVSAAAALSANDKVAVAAANSDYIMVGGTQYNVGDETVYTITREYKTDGVTIDTVSVSAGGSYSKDNKVSFTLTTDGKLKVAFIYDDIK